MSRSNIIAKALIEEEDFDAREWLLSQERPEVQTEEVLLRDRESGRLWKVRIVLPGGRYGRENVLFHVEQDPLIEFWDMGQFNGQGQFVSRYYWSTLDKDKDRLQLHGLDLQGDEPAWKVSGQFMTQMFNWAPLVIARWQR